jgi:predicted  nucleic acid-binding Zn-ribbon protein
MDARELQPSYTMRDMVKMFQRVDALTREKNALVKQLAAKDTELTAVKAECADLTAQLDQLQRDLAQQGTAPRILRKLS